jgi:hypothetical protein
MNKATLFAVILFGFLMSSFHHPQGSSTMASNTPNAARSISSEKLVTVKAAFNKSAQPPVESAQ